MMLKPGLANTRIANARRAVGRGIRYRMGHGGLDPHDDLPTETGYCDCSGFAAWVLGVSRRPKPGRNFWIETTNIVRDALHGGKNSTFVWLERPVAGCFVVYGDRKVLGVHKEGHIALVTLVKARGAFNCIDCSASESGKFKEAIREWDRTDLFERNKAIFVVLRQDFAA